MELAKLRQKRWVKSALYTFGKLRQLMQRRWLRLLIYAVVVAGVTYGFYLLVGYLAMRFNIQHYAATAYLIVFVVTLVSCAGLFVPVYIHVALMVAVAKIVAQVSPWGPVLVAVAATTGGTLGEITGYYTGYLGKRIAQVENLPGYQRLVGWMTRHGMLAIYVMSLQPILPFDIAGLVAGAARMPLWKFLLPCWGGRFPKYLVACLVGSAVLNVLHLPSF